MNYPNNQPWSGSPNNQPGGGVPPTAPYGNMPPQPGQGPAPQPQQSRLGKFLTRDIISLTGGVALFVFALLLPFGRLLTLYSVEATDGTELVLKGNGKVNLDSLFSSAVSSGSSSDNMFTAIFNDFFSQLSRELTRSVQDAVGVELPFLIGFTLLLMLSAIIIAVLNPRLGATIALGASSVALLGWIAVMIFLSRIGTESDLASDPDIYDYGMGAAVWWRLICLILIIGICLAMLLRPRYQDRIDNFDGNAMKARFSQLANQAMGQSQQQPQGQAPQGQAPSGGYPPAGPGPYGTQ